jgi:hypothetical protein
MLERGRRTLIPQRYATVVTALISRQLSVHVEDQRKWERGSRTVVHSSAATAAASSATIGATKAKVLILAVRLRERR